MYVEMFCREEKYSAIDLLSTSEKADFPAKVSIHGWLEAPPSKIKKGLII
jgi:hypothetical protein